ncbi:MULTISPECIES: beta/gamma crystallin domain-containing protein [Streptomyces]|uniref:beta/gamma crystallin domain-containing protein n=1 Tax=Streptomyces TaxID=1883 RepID=UPI002FDBEF4C
MKQVSKRLLVAAMAAVGLTFTMPATPAAAINVTSCGDPTLPPRTDLAWIGTSTGNRMCFANSGEMKVSFNDVTTLHAGNNIVTFSYIVEENDKAVTFTVRKGEEQTLSFGFHARVNTVRICGGAIDCPL